MRVVVNTSPLIALERIGQLDLLRQLFGTVIRPQAVRDELEAGRKKHGLSAALISSRWILTEPNPAEMVLRKELGAGETAAITLALATRADLVALDDLQARLVAEGLGLKLTGTLGILAAAHKLGLLADLHQALRHLEKAHFYIPQEIKKAFLS